jgi:FKBP-type peptidyl-prolyl cis-trans isomerase FklB
MSKLTILAIVCALSVTTYGQTKKPAAKKTPAKKATAKSATPASTMKNALDSFSYAVGISIANFYKEQGVKEINNAMVMKALSDVKNGKPLMDDAQTNNCIVDFMQNVRSEKAAGNKKEGEAFLNANKTKPGVVVLPSGLQYQIVKEGTGPKPTETDKVKVHYEGKLIDGTFFDSSIQRGEPIEFNVNGVIAGWTEALQLMPVGSKWILYIPSSLAYGDNQAGPTIKPGSTLIFEVELLDIVK